MDLHMIPFEAALTNRTRREQPLVSKELRELVILLDQDSTATLMSSIWSRAKELL